MIELPTNAPPTPPKYARWAFFNVYNLGLFGGALAAATLSGQWFLALAAAGLETVWMLVGPEAHAFKRWVDKHHRDQWAAEADKRRKAIVDSLPDRDAVRVRQLEFLREEILREAKQNPSFANVLLEIEFGKLDQLRDGFVQLAAAACRAEEHLASIDYKDLQGQLQRQENISKNTKDGQARSIAERNVEVIKKRLEAIEDIRNFLGRARGQMTLIENTVSLMRDRVLTMRSPQELAEPLDDMLQGLDAVRAAVERSDDLLTGVGPIADAGSVPVVDAPARATERG